MAQKKGSREKSSYLKIFFRMGRINVVNNPYAQAPQVIDRNTLDLSVADQSTVDRSAYQGSNMPAKLRHMKRTYYNAAFIDKMRNAAPHQAQTVKHSILNPVRNLGQQLQSQIASAAPEAKESKEREVKNSPKP